MYCMSFSHMFFTFPDLNKLVKKLDKRSKSNVTNCQLKPRIPSTPSSQGPPDCALRWAVDSVWFQDKENVPASEAVSSVVRGAQKVLDFLSESDSSY